MTTDRTIPLFWRVWRAQLLPVAAYLLLVAALAVALWRIQVLSEQNRAEATQAAQRNAEQSYSICLAQKEGREYLRFHVIEFADLARSITVNRPEYVEQVNEFQRDQLAHIPEIKCPPPTASER